MARARGRLRGRGWPACAGTSPTSIPSKRRATARALRGRGARPWREMIAEAETIFAEFAAGEPEPAGAADGGHGPSYANVLSALLRAAQRRERRPAAAVRRSRRRRRSKLQRYEVLIAALIVLMVGAAIVYGRRIAREMGQESVARERYRLELEKQMEERTQALRESEAALARAASEWRRTFDAIDSPVMILDLEGRMVRANATVRALTGKGSAGGLTGRVVTSHGRRRAVGRPRRGWRRRRARRDRRRSAEAHGRRQRAELGRVRVPHGAARTAATAASSSWPRTRRACSSCGRRCGGRRT